MRDAFHQTAIAKENIGEMINHGELGAIEVIGEQFLRQRHPDGVCQALPQGAGGRFYACRITKFGVTRSLAVELPK